MLNCKNIVQHVNNLITDVTLSLRSLVKYDIEIANDMGISRNIVTLSCSCPIHKKKIIEKIGHRLFSCSTEYVHVSTHIVSLSVE